MKTAWFVKDGSIFSNVLKSKKSQEFRLGKTYDYYNAIALNVGNELANHIVKLHNEHIHSRLQFEEKR